MGIIDFESIYKEVKDKAVDVAVSAYKSNKKEATADVVDYLTKAKAKIKDYTLQLTSGKLSKEEFNFNIAGLKELCEMKALKACGIAEIALDKLKSNIESSIINTIISKI
jgi:hypothetical protein